LIQKRLKKQATLGITGLYLLRVQIEKEVWHLDVGLEDPLGSSSLKGRFVQPLNLYMS